MTLNEYQRLAERTINTALDRRDIEMHALHGMVGEIGEIHSIYQKKYQGHPVDEGDLMKEVGDLMWFVAEFAFAHEWELDDVGQMNIDKLRRRYPDGFSAERSVHREV